MEKISPVDSKNKQLYFLTLNIFIVLVSVKINFLLSQKIFIIINMIHGHRQQGAGKGCAPWIFIYGTLVQI